MRARKLTDGDLDFLYKNIENGARFCAESLGVSTKQVIVFCGKNHVKRTLHKKRQDNLVDMSLFYDIKLPEISYFLGLLWSDGNICEESGSQKRISIKMLFDDLNEVKSRFSPLIGLKETIRTPKERRTQLCLRIGNRPLYDFLFENDYKYKSLLSPCKIIKLIPDNLLKYFWRGIFDGDGHVRVTTGKIKSYRFSIHGSFNQDWKAYEDLMSKLGIEYSIYRQIEKKTNYSRSSVACANKFGFVKFFNYIYENYDGLGLSRKYNTFLSGVNFINSFHRSRRDNES